MSEKKIQLEYRLKQGDVARYRTTVEADTEVMAEGKTNIVSSIMEMITTQTVKSIFPDDGIKLEVSIDSASLKRNGEEIPVPYAGQVMPVKMKKNGEIFQMSENGSGGQTHPSFPDTPVGKGDTWAGESKLEIPGSDKTVILKTDHILENFEHIKGYDCVKINVSSPETVIPLQENITQTMTVTGTTYFAYNEGKLIKSIVETDTSMKVPSGHNVNSFTKMIIELDGNNRF